MSAYGMHTQWSSTDFAASQDEAVLVGAEGFYLDTDFTTEPGDTIALTCSDGKTINVVVVTGAFGRGDSALVTIEQDGADG